MNAPTTPYHAPIETLSIPLLYALADAPLRRLLADTVPLTHASEIAIWAKDPAADQLVALIDTSGPDGAIEMKISQPLSSGIVSQVYRDQAPFLDRGLWRSKKGSPLVDKALNQLTQNQMSVPFSVGGAKLGVLCAVQLTDAKHGPPSRWGFDELDLKILTFAAHGLAQSLERSLLNKRLGA